MLRVGPDHFGNAVEEEGLRIRLLGPIDMAAVERHFLALSPADRNARFHSALSDWAIAAYVRRLDPARAILMGAFGGAFSSANWLLGFAEAHPTPVPRTVEVAVTVDPWCRRRGLGRRLVGEVVARAFAAGAGKAEFLFTDGNAALPGLVTALGAEVDLLRGYAAISRPVQAVPGRPDT